MSRDVSGAVYGAVDVAVSGAVSQAVMNLPLVAKKPLDRAMYEGARAGGTVGVVVREAVLATMDGATNGQPPPTS